MPIAQAQGEARYKSPSTRPTLTCTPASPARHIHHHPSRNPPSATESKAKAKTMDRYASLHTSPNGPGDSRPTAEQILRDQDLIGQWPDKVILVTGATAGLGMETARVLQQTGAKVYITARDTSKAETILQKISDSRYRPIDVVELDLSSSDSIQEGVKKFLEKESKLNVLINNAGIMACPPRRTKDGFEMQFGTNHLGHFLLFQLLKPALLAASTPDFASRVISVSSAGHRRSDIRPDINYDLIAAEEYNPFPAYGQSKTANILFANELDRHFCPKIRGLSLHPGVIFDTELGRHQEDGGEGLVIHLSAANPDFKKGIKSLGQGAATQVWAATAKELEGKGGLYLDDVQVAKADEECGGKAGYKAYIYDEENARRLWEDSVKMVGVGGEEAKDEAQMGQVSSKGGHVHASPSANSLASRAASHT
jgi:NAD(P)-dependent dehydrogenase (short-subunit alcohol dehydrogenase family)